MLNMFSSLDKWAYTNTKNYKNATLFRNEVVKFSIDNLVDLPE